MLVLETENDDARAQAASARAAAEQSSAEVVVAREAAEEARARAAVAAESASAAQADAVRDAASLEREIRCVHLLTGALAEAEVDLERLHTEHDALVASSRQTQQTASSSLVTRMQERAELDRQLGEVSGH